MSDSWFVQDGYQCRIRWGHRGAAVAAERGDILVIVDVLCFSSTVVTAIQQGISVIPCASSAEAAQISATEKEVVAAVRREAAGEHDFSLSPTSFVGKTAGAVVALPSPNGATCCRIAAANPQCDILVGCLLNADAVALRVNSILRNCDTGRNVTVLACGERWEDNHAEGPLRFAVEDYIGAGAIIDKIEASRSPEAELSARSFVASRHDLNQLIWKCGSGVELRNRGYSQEVHHVSKLNLYSSTPGLVRGRFACSTC